MKKLLCGLLCLCVLFSLCGLGVAADDSVTMVTITVENGALTLKESTGHHWVETDGSTSTATGYCKIEANQHNADWEFTLNRTNFCLKMDESCKDKKIRVIVSQSATLGDGSVLYCDVLNDGNITGTITNNGYLDSSRGTVSGSINNYGTLKSCNIGGTVTNHGEIVECSFSGTVVNHATISEGTFSGTVENYGTITGGTFKGRELRNKSGGLISGGHFTETISVTNEAGGSITGGNFDTASPLQNNGAISGGSFHKVNNDGTISATEDRMPTFDFSVYNNPNGTISGGNFTQDCRVYNYENITGGTFSGTVYNYSTITGGTFAKDIVDEGGTVNLPQTNPDPAPVPQPVTPAPAEPVWDVEVEEEEEEIELLKGSKQKYTQGADEGLSFRFDAKVKNFRRLKIDGKTVDKANYEVSEGSTIITLNPEYMDTLKAGKHTLKAIFKDGSAEVKFTVLEGAKVEASAPAADADKLNPSTGADDFVGVAAALAVLSVGAAAALTMKKKKV